MRQRWGIIGLVLVLAAAALAVPPVRAQDGGIRVVLEPAAGFEVDDAVMSQVAATVERRVNGLGVTDAIVQRQGDRRIVVWLPGVREQRMALEAIQQTGLLEFVDFSMVMAGQYQEGDCLLTTTQVAMREASLAAGEVPPTYDAYTCPGDPPAPALLQDGQPFQTVMTGEGFGDATAEPSSFGSIWQVNFTLKGGEASEPFITYVANNANRPLAIVLDGRLISYPTIQAGFSQAALAGTVDGGVITGNFTPKEATILAAQLRYGALPVPLDVVEVVTVDVIPAADETAGPAGRLEIVLVPGDVVLLDAVPLVIDAFKALGYEAAVRVEQPGQIVAEVPSIAQADLAAVLSALEPGTGLRVVSLRYDALTDAAASE